MKNNKIDVTGDGKYDVATDGKWIDNAIKFSTLSSSEQINTVKNLSPAYAAVLISGMCTDNKVSQAMDVMSALPTETAAKVADQMAVTEQGAKNFAAMVTHAAESGEVDKAAGIVNAMTPANAAAVLEHVPATAAVKIVEDEHMTNAGAIFNALTKLADGAKIAAAILSGLAPEKAATVLIYMDAADAQAIIYSDAMTAAAAAKIFNVMDKLTIPDGKTSVEKILSGINTKDPARSARAAKAAAILNAMDPALAAADLLYFHEMKTINIGGMILGNSNMSNAQAIKILSEMGKTADGAEYAANLITDLFTNAATSTKAPALLNGLTGTAKTNIETALGAAKTAKISGSAASTTTTGSTTTGGTTAGTISDTAESTASAIPYMTREQLIERMKLAASAMCTSSDETFPDGSITIFWMSDEPIPVQDLNAYAPGWQLHMLVTADFDGNGTTETQDWLMHSSMVSMTGRSIDLDMPPELNGKTVTVAFYVTDANGNPLLQKTDTATNTWNWDIGSKANKDTAYVFGAGLTGKPTTALTFKVNRDPARGEQAPAVAGYSLSGGSLTIGFATPLDPWYFTAAYVVVNGIYTQISDYQYMLSEDQTTITIDLNAFGISVKSGDKVQFVLKEWANGMTPLQTVIGG